MCCSSVQPTNRHTKTIVVSKRVGTVKQKQPRTLHIRQCLQFSQQAALFLESGGEDALNPKRRSRKLPARCHLRNRLRVPAPRHLAVARTADSSLAEISCDTRMLLDRASDIIERGSGASWIAVVTRNIKITQKGGEVFPEPRHRGAPGNTEQMLNPPARSRHRARFRGAGHAPPTKGRWRCRPMPAHTRPQDTSYLKQLRQEGSAGDRVVGTPAVERDDSRVGIQVARCAQQCCTLEPEARIGRVSWCGPNSLHTVAPKFATPVNGLSVGITPPRPRAASDSVPPPAPDKPLIGGPRGGVACQHCGATGALVSVWRACDNSPRRTCAHARSRSFAHLRNR